MPQSQDSNKCANFLMVKKSIPSQNKGIGPVHMVKKGHKYVTFLQINVRRVMILSQKLKKRTFI